MSQDVRQFLSRFLAVVCLLALTCVLPIHFAVQRTDFFYSKFLYTSNSLILGTSRAFRGLNPDVIGKDLEIDRPFLNFAFTLSNSPYGPKYFKAVQRKVNPSTQKGLYILEVSPLAVSTLKTNPDDKETLYRENNGVIDNILFTANPNLEYLVKHAERPIYSVFTKLWKSQEQVYENGWNPSQFRNQAAIEKAIARTASVYENEVFPQYFVSSKRLAALEETVDFLATKGQVFLVRIPVSQPMWKLEDRYMTSFDTVMIAIAQRHNATYLNFRDSASEFDTVDVHHLSADAAIKLSTRLNQQIQPAFFARQTPQS